MRGARNRNRTCQEASPFARGEYLPCGGPAVCIVDNGDTAPYWMCAGCASHNVNNRGGIRWCPCDPVGELLSDVAAFLDERADVSDGPDGPVPDRAMSLHTRVLAMIEKAGG